MRHIEIEPLPRSLMARVLFGWLLLMLLYFGATDSLVHQWEQPVLTFPRGDTLYWLLHLLDIPQSIMRNQGASWAFDIILVAATAAMVVFPRTPVLALLVVAGLWIFLVMYGSANGHHYHHAGIIIIPLPFLVRKPVHFYFTWHFVRYWVLFLFVCGAFYKLHYGGFFQMNNMASILKQHYQPHLGPRSLAAEYLIRHPLTAQRFYQAATFLQLTCMVGFFTRRFDGWILTAVLLFHAGNIFLLNIPFWENSLMVAPLLPWHRINRLIRNYGRGATGHTLRIQGVSTRE